MLGKQCHTGLFYKFRDGNEIRSIYQQIDSVNGDMILLRGLQSIPLENIIKIKY